MRAWRGYPLRMKSLLSGLLVVALCTAAQAADLSAPIKTIRAVGSEGQGNAAAAKAWQSLSKAEATALPQILTAMDGANPLAANWLRAAVDTIASRAKDMPQKELLDFLNNQKHNPRARRLAFELIQKTNPQLAAKLIPGLINDPSVELRREAVGQVLETGAKHQAAKQSSAAVKAYRNALDAARDIDQIKAATKALRDLKQEVDLPRHFGFLMHWNVIGPFDNTERAGFAKVYPPETNVDLGATYDGKASKVKWIPFVTVDEYGMVDINKAYPGPGDGLKEVTAYAYTEYHAAAAGSVQLRLGCKNAWKIWLNGKLVFGRDEYHRGMRIDQYQLDVNLGKGRNTLLIKLCQNEQMQDWTKQWQFQLRVCDPTGTAVLATDRPATPKKGTNNQ